MKAPGAAALVHICPARSHVSLDKLRDSTSRDTRVPSTANREALSPVWARGRAWNRLQGLSTPFLSWIFTLVHTGMGRGAGGGRWNSHDLTTLSPGRPRNTTSAWPKHLSQNVPQLCPCSRNHRSLRKEARLGSLSPGASQLRPEQGHGLHQGRDVLAELPVLDVPRLCRESVQGQASPM